jgi:hypothetical protein
VIPGGKESCTALEGSSTYVHILSGDQSCVFQASNHAPGRPGKPKLGLKKWRSVISYKTKRPSQKVQLEKELSLLEHFTIMYDEAMKVVVVIYDKAMQGYSTAVYRSHWSDP